MTIMMRIPPEAVNAWIVSLVTIKVVFLITVNVSVLSVLQLFKLFCHLFEICSQHVHSNNILFQRTRCSRVRGWAWPRTPATGPCCSPRASPGGSPCCSSTRSHSSLVRSSKLRKFTPQLSEDSSLILLDLS